MASSNVPYERSLDEAEERRGCGSTLACDPLRPLHRYLMLFFICFLSFGSYFCYDNPAALQDVMIRDLDLTETQFMNTYAFYSWPNVILSFVGGMLIDRVFGIALGAIIFSIFVSVGQVLFGAGAFANSIGLIYFARFVFGIGAESLAVAQNTYASEWFPPTELNFVFGLQLSMARVGSTVNMVTMQSLYRAVGDAFAVSGHRRLGTALFIAAITCLFSTLCAIILAYFTRRARRIRQAHEARLAASARSQPSPGSSSPDGNSRPEAEQKPEPERISFRDIVHFPVAIWLICVICVAYYVTVFPFVSLGLVFFQRKFRLSVTEAGVVNSLIYVISAVASPVLGAAIDFTGCNLHWVLSSVMLTLVCHLCFAFTSGALPPIVIMIAMGIAYSVLAGSLWPLVAYLLPVHQRGTAYGLIQSVQNLGLGLISIFAGYLVDTKGYLFLEVFFTFCLSLTLAVTFMLYVWDHRHGDVLNESGARRRAKAAEVVEIQQSLNQQSIKPVDA